MAVAKHKRNYEAISPTAWATARARSYSDIIYAKKIFKVMKEIEDNNYADSIKNFNIKKIAPALEARYKLMNILLEKNGARQILELASGLSPRGLGMADEGIEYVEVELPNIVLQKREIFTKLRQKLPENFHIRMGNALKLKDLFKAVRYFNSNERIAVINEGLLRYLNFEEKAIVAKNVHTLLEKFGGVWITPDITLMGGAVKEKAIQQTKRATGMDISSNIFENSASAIRFFEKLGFQIEKHSLLEVEGQLITAKELKLSKKAVKNSIEDWVVFVMRIKGGS